MCDKCGCQNPWRGRGPDPRTKKLRVPYNVLLRLAVEHGRLTSMRGAAQSEKAYVHYSNAADKVLAELKELLRRDHA